MNRERYRVDLLRTIGNVIQFLAGFSKLCLGLRFSSRAGIVFPQLVYLHEVILSLLARFDAGVVSRSSSGNRKRRNYV